MFADLNKSFESPFTRANEFDEVGFCKLADLYGDNPDRVWKVAGLWVNPKSEFGAHPVVMILDESDRAKVQVSLPQNQILQAEAILAEDSMVAAINEGKCGLRVREYYMKKYKRKCYAADWVDLA